MEEAFELGVVGATALYSTSRAEHPASASAAAAVAAAPSQLLALTVAVLCAAKLQQKRGNGLRTGISHAEGAVVGALIVPLVVTALLHQGTAATPATAAALPTDVGGIGEDMVWLCIAMSYVSVLAPLFRLHSSRAPACGGKASPSFPPIQDNAAGISSSISISSIGTIVAGGAGAMLWAYGVVGSGLGSAAVVLTLTEVLWVVNAEGFTLGERGCIAQAVSVLTIQMARFTAAKMQQNQRTGGSNSTTLLADTAIVASSDAEAALLCAGAAVLGVLWLVASGWFLLSLCGHTMPSAAPPPFATSALFYAYTAAAIFGPLMMWASLLLGQSALGWFSTFVIMSPQHLAAIGIWAAMLAASVETLQLWCNSLQTHDGGTSTHGSSSSSNSISDGGRAKATLSRHDKLHLRKAFHLLVVSIVVPALLLVPDFLRLALAIACAALVLIELLRNAKIPPFGSATDGFLQQFRDDRDPGAVFVTHIYLLLACACPIWLSNAGSFAAYAGVLSIGVGDATASVCGLRYGRTRWPGGTTSKTLEGSCASLVAQVAVVCVLSGLGVGQPSCGVLDTLPALAAGVVMEATTLQVDNLVVPPLVFVLLVHAERV